MHGRRGVRRCLITVTLRWTASATHPTSVSHLVRRRRRACCESLPVVRAARGRLAEHASKQDAAETSAANGSDATGAQGAGGEANGHATAPGGDADVRSSAGSGIAEAALIKAHRDQIHEMMDIVKAVRGLTPGPRAHTAHTPPESRRRLTPPPGWFVRPSPAQEMRLVGERNKGEATQMAYMDRVDSLLSKKLALIMQLKAKLTRFREGMAM